MSHDFGAYDIFHISRQRPVFIALLTIILFVPKSVIVSDRKFLLSQNPKASLSDHRPSHLSFPFCPDISHHAPWVQIELYVHIWFRHHSYPYIIIYEPCAQPHYEHYKKQQEFIKLSIVKNMFCIAGQEISWILRIKTSKRIFDKSGSIMRSDIDYHVLFKKKCWCNVNMVHFLS